VKPLLCNMRSRSPRAGYVTVRRATSPCFSWSEHLTLDLPPPYQAPYVSGGALVLHICGAGGGDVRSFFVQSIPSPPRGIPERHWRIDFDFALLCFILDATQDVLAVVPMRFYHAAYLCARCPLASHTPSLPMGESFDWKLPNTLRREIANTRYAATFSA